MFFMLARLALAPIGVRIDSRFLVPILDAILMTVTRVSVCAVDSPDLPGFHHEAPPKRLLWTRYGV